MTNMNIQAIDKIMQAKWVSCQYELCLPFALSLSVFFLKVQKFNLSLTLALNNKTAWRRVGLVSCPF